MVARSLSSRYTRSKVRKAIPRDSAYIIDELLHTHPDENNYREMCIIDSTCIASLSPSTAHRAKVKRVAPRMPARSRISRATPSPLSLIHICFTSPPSSPAFLSTRGTEKSLTVILSVTLSETAGLLYICLLYTSYTFCG